MSGKGDHGSLDNSTTRISMMSSFLGNKTSRARSSIPVLWTQSAGSRLEVTEIRVITVGLRERVQALRQNKAKILKQHGAYQDLLLENEAEILKLRQQRVKTAKVSVVKIEEYRCTLAERIKALQDMRARHLHEVDLFKRSCSGVGKWIAAVAEHLKVRLHHFEVQLAALTALEREAAARYQTDLANLLVTKQTLEAELRLEAQARSKGLAAAVHLRGRLRMQDNPRKEPILSPNPSPRQILNNIKQRLSLSPPS